MKRTNAFARIVVLALAVVVLQSCMLGTALKSVPADRTQISGTYTLFLYGCHYPDQADNAAILLNENSKYTLEIYDIATSYKVKKGVPGEQALAEADVFVRCSSHSVWMTRVAAISDDNGGVMGYEMRPLYHPLEFGVSDVMQIGYRLKDGTIRVYINKDPEFDRMPGVRDDRGHSSGSYGY